MTRIAQEFSRFAGTYSQYNRIQVRVAKKLVSMLPRQRYGSILDLGSGRGEVCRHLEEQQIAFEQLTALDISPEMLALHPDASNISKIRGDFNSPQAMTSLLRKDYDLLISASALQWSSDLDATFAMLAPLVEQHYYAIFTSGTFRSLHRCAGVESPIYSTEVLKRSISCYYDATFETLHYTLHFDSVRKMLRYIKESGTSGGDRRLNYTQTKYLLENYPLDYLEFEVLFVSSKS